MNYEKKYKEALERARQFHATNVDENKKSTEYIFPELADSKDERVRKYLLKLAERCPNDSIDFMNEVKKEDVIVWLEKQCEQKPAWSEEDEEIWIDAIKYLELFDAQGIHGNVAIPCIKWLKSLKERMKPQWKPSKGQLNALNALNLHGDISYVGQQKQLIELYEQLKKL